MFLSSLASSDDSRHDRPDLARQIEKWGLHDAGFAYNIVSVFGSQSTGKSAHSGYVITVLSAYSLF